MKLRFGDCVFDAGARQVRRDGRQIELSPKAFDLLRLLLAARPRVLTRAEIFDRLWPKTFVSATSLPRVVTELRKALGDARTQSQYIRTVHGHGYAFCGEARDEDAVTGASACALRWAGREIPVPEGESRIGRAEDCFVRSRSSRVSRHHSVLRVEGIRATIEDLGSRNGTFVAGRRIGRATELADGDVIGVGPEVLVFLGPGSPGSTERDGG